jgi:hypothetical protein
MFAVSDFFCSTAPINDQNQYSDQIQQNQKFEKDTPATLRSLLFQGRESQFFEQLAFPSRVFILNFHGTFSGDEVKSENYDRWEGIIPKWAGAKYSAESQGNMPCLRGRQGNRMNANVVDN